MKKGFWPNSVGESGKKAGQIVHLYIFSSRVMHCRVNGNIWRLYFRPSVCAVIRPVSRLQFLTEFLWNLYFFYNSFVQNCIVSTLKCTILARILWNLHHRFILAMSWTNSKISADQLIFIEWCLLEIELNWELHFRRSHMSNSYPNLMKVES